MRFPLLPLVPPASPARPRPGPTRTHTLPSTPTLAPSVELKELRLRPVTEAHDYAVKLKQAQAFLSKVSLHLGGRAAASSGTRGEVEEAVEPLREAAALEQAWAGALSRQAAARGD